MTEAILQREIMLAVCKTGARVFRNNTGLGWTGHLATVTETGRGRVVAIANPRPLHAGLCVGSSDLIGWTRDGRFLAIEVKSAKGRLTDEQRNFGEQVEAAGGIFIVGRSVEQVLEELNG